MTAPRQELVTDALLASLSALLSPLAVGDAKAPDPSPGEKAPNTPYVIVDFIDATFDGAPGSDSPEAVADWVYQFTAVGKFRSQAEFVKDKVHTALLGRDAVGFVNTIVVAGATVGRREHNSHVPLQRDGDLVTCGERITFGVALTS